MNFGLWGSSDEEVENEFTEFWEELKQQEQTLEDQDIDFDAVEEFGRNVSGLEAGDFFKPRETHQVFDSRTTDEDLESYRDSGLLTEIDLGDHSNFLFVTGRGEYVMDNWREIVENRVHYEKLIRESGEKFWQLGEADEVVEEGPQAVRGDLEEDYLVKQDRGGLIRGGWEPRLTERGREVKDRVEQYNTRVIDGLIDAKPYPDPELLQLVETVIISGTSSVRERLKLVEGFMAEKRQAYESELEEFDSDFKSYTELAHQMADEWEEVYQCLKQRQENLRSSSGEITDEGTQYLEVLRERIDDLRDAVSYLGFENPHESDVEEVRNRIKDLECTYWQEIRN